MNNNKILILFSLILIILSLNVISAATNDIDITANDIHKIVKNDLDENTIVKQTLDNNVYVDNNSPSQTEDGSIENPYKTISNENLEQISANSTVIVSKGTYYLNPISITRDITIIGENQDEVIFIPNYSSSTFVIGNDVTVNFKNFTLKDFTSDSQAAITNNGKLNIENLKLLNNIGTTGANNGGSILNNGNLEIINTTFEDNMASFGAAVYSTSNVTVYNSSFINNEIYNVGGAIYNAQGNLAVYDSHFESNHAVSGAAIYSAFGNLYVNNTGFYRNSADHFFGGAIYSTGFATTENCVFDSNFANKDGGAITNTNNFTIINCSFLENGAGENGGAIENVPWTEVENGNLTIINSTFMGNGARQGGVFINYGKKESVGEPATITVRNSIFQFNSGSNGGIVYNEQYIDFEDCVFVDNDADDCLISSDESWIKSINNNWWGTNDPSIEEIGVTPDNWRVLKFTNTTELTEGEDATVEVSLNTLNNDETVSSDIPVRNATFTADKSIFAQDNMPITNVINNAVEYMGDELLVQVDNQVLSLKVAKIKNTTINLTVNSQIKYNQTDTITGILVDEDNVPLSDKVIKLLINNGRATVKTGEDGTFNYDYSFKRTGINNITATFKGDEDYTNTSQTANVEVKAQDTKIVLEDIDAIKYGQNVTITGKLADINDNIIANNTIKLLINNGRATVKTDEQGIFTYTYKLSRVGTNNITVTYLGTNKYAPSKAATTVLVEALDTKISLDNLKSTKKGNDIMISGQLLDEDGNVVVGTVKLLINNGRATVKTGADGIFTYTYTVNRVGVNNITASYLGSNKYTNSTTNTSVEVTKLDTKVIIDPIGTVTHKTNVTFTGRLLDGNDNALYGTVKLLINNGRATVKTDADGYYSYTYNATRIGTNNVTATYLESNNYLESQSKESFIVESKT